MLQTSSNQRDSHRLSRASVTNVVNLRPKTLIFSEKAVGLTTFVTTDQKSTRKTPPIDDVCNNTQRSTPKSQHDKPYDIGGPEGLAAAVGLARLRDNAPSHTSATTPHWCEGRRRDRRAWLRCPWAVAGPGRASRRRAERSSRRGRRAGGPPPTGTQSSPAPQAGPPAPGTPAGHKQQARIQKRPPGTGWAYLSRLWESNPRPIHYE